MDTLLSMKVFCQVVQSGSFTRAAERVGISVPMASKHVAHLEKSLGTRLFYRNNRSLKPTEQGEAYYRDCSYALELLAQYGNAELTARFLDYQERYLKKEKERAFFDPDSL